VYLSVRMCMYVYVMCMCLCLCLCSVCVSVCVWVVSITPQMCAGVYEFCARRFRRTSIGTHTIRGFRNSPPVRVSKQ
jgi:hypothetical protein